MGPGKTGSGTERRLSARNRQRAVLPGVLPQPLRLSPVLWEEPECLVLVGYLLLKANPNETQRKKSVLFFLRSSGTCISENLDTGLNFFMGGMKSMGKETPTVLPIQTSAAVIFRGKHKGMFEVFKDDVTNAISLKKKRERKRKQHTESCGEQTFVPRHQHNHCFPENLPGT